MPEKPVTAGPWPLPCQSQLSNSGVRIERFAREAREAGVDGIIAADIPADEGEPLIRAARPVGVDTIFLVVPTSTEARLRTVASATTGFLYCVSVTGVTGPATG
jgi:tryptophan synthase alpha chain